MKEHLVLVLCGCILLHGCGGGAMPGSPQASLSASNLAFGGPWSEGETTPPDALTVTSSGTHALQITSITATANFGETDNCSVMLAPGTKCTINVTFSPIEAGSLTGTLSISDNAAGSPQKASLTGRAVCLPKAAHCDSNSPQFCCSGSCSPSQNACN